MNDELIKNVAFQMCRELGLNPMEYMKHSNGQDSIPRQFEEHNAMNNQLMESPRWMLYRYKAVLAIASYNACKMVMGKE